MVCFKVRKKAKIRNRYNQVPRLNQDTEWESDKNTRKHHVHEILFCSANSDDMRRTYGISLESALSAIIQDLKLNLRTILISLIQYFEDDVL